METLNQTKTSGSHLNETAPPSPAVAVNQASPTPSPVNVLSTPRTAKHDRHKSAQQLKHKLDRKSKQSRGQPSRAKRQPNQPRKQGTRGARADAAVTKSLSDASDRENADVSDSEDSSSESEDVADAQAPPAILNPDPHTCDPLKQGDRYIFCPTSVLPQWPAYATTALPLFLTVLFLGASSRLLAPALILVTIMQLYWLAKVKSMLLSRNYLSWLRTPSMPPNVNLAVASSAAEALHTIPEHDMSAWFTCRLIWYLQALSSHLAPLSRAVSGIVYHHSTVSEVKTALDTRLPSQRGVKAVADCVQYDVWTVASVARGTSTVMVSSESIARQLVPRLLPLSPADRLLQSESMASRCANLIVRGSLAPEVQRGSARLAVIQCSAADASSQVATYASTYSALLVQVPLVLALAAVLVLMAPAGTQFATAFGAHPSFWVHVAYAPVIEELLKTLFARLTRTGRVFSSLAYGCFEFAVGTALEIPTSALVPALIFHAVIGCVSTGPAIILHSLFNTCIHAANDFYAEPGAGSDHSYPHGWFKDSAPPTPTGISRTPHLTADLDVAHQVELIVADLCALWRNPYWQHYGSVFSQHPWFHPNLHCATSYAAMAVFSALSLPFISASTREKGKRLCDCALYAVGYRVGEVNLPAVANHTARITLLPSFFELARRVSSSCTLGFSLRSIVPPFPDFTHPPTALHGVLKRFCKTPPTPNARKLRRLRRFVARYVAKHYVPIDATADVSVPTWLERTNYPQWRKDQLFRCWNDHPWLEDGDFENAGFIKKETYGAYKAARGINSRSDVFKCYSGPFFKLMEDQVYHQDCFDGERLTPGDQGPFIKHIPVHMRPEFLERMLGPAQGPYYETDYSEFEKHFTPSIMQALELQLYKHMLANFPEVYSNIERALSTTNVCRYKGFIIRILGKRMSGDMCTSLGNGFSNLMLFKFVAHCKGGYAFGVVEGDDALFYSSVEMTAQDFADIGFEIKIESYQCLHSSSFCGMLSSQDGIIIRDISRVIPKFGWSMSPRRLGGVAVRMGLLRARALSLAYECPQCPIICALAKRALSVTYGFRPIFEATQYRAQIAEWVELFGSDMSERLLAGPTLQARVDFADKFGISVPCQLRAEDIFNNWDGTPLDHPFINSLFYSNTDMAEFAETNVAEDERMVVDRADALAL